MNTSIYKLIMVLYFHSGATCGLSTSPSVDVKKDAKDMVDSHFNELTVATILTARTPQQCQQINAEIAKINGGIPLIDDKYVPYKKNESVYKDLLFALLYEEDMVLAKYLGEFMGHKDETLITVDLLLVKDMLNFISNYYNRVQGDGFEDDRKEQRCPFCEVLKAWVQADREPENGVLPTEKEAHDTMMDMYEEQQNWDTEDKRPLLNTILMKKSCTYSAAILKKYEARHPGDTIEDDLFYRVSNKDVLFAYQCLAGLVKDKFRLWAKLLHDLRDIGDRNAAWILIVAMNRGENMAKIDAAFKADFGGESLGSFILKKKDDPTVIEILAKLVDPTHKLNIVPSAPTGPQPGPAPT